MIRRIQEVFAIPAADACHHGIDGGQDVADEQETADFYTDAVRAVPRGRVPGEEFSTTEGEELAEEGCPTGRWQLCRPHGDGACVGQINSAAVQGCS
jgi:hypothetical protein